MYVREKTYLGYTRGRGRSDVSTGGKKGKRFREKGLKEKIAREFGS